MKEILTNPNASHTTYSYQTTSSPSQISTTVCPPKTFNSQNDRRTNLVVFVIDPVVELLELLEFDETGQGGWRCDSGAEVGVLWEWILRG